MKTINLTVFSFDELSENVQKKIIEREHWNLSGGFFFRGSNRKML